jgi:phosphosulfolactate synthase
MAIQQNTLAKHLKAEKELGFDSVEISENVITIEHDRRLELVKEIGDFGFKILYEYGTKFPNKPMFGLPIESVIEEMKEILESGAELVIIERDEVNLLRKTNPDQLVELVKRVGMENLLLEAGPGYWPELAVWLLRTFGSHVNLGNVYPDQVMVLEEYRMGLHRDVHFDFLERKT